MSFENEIGNFENELSSEKWTIGVVAINHHQQVFQGLDSE